MLLITDKQSLKGYLPYSHASKLPKHYLQLVTKRVMMHIYHWLYSVSTEKKWMYKII